MSEYSASRQADAWHDWYPDHWNSGNGSLIDAYTSRLQPAISLNTRVLRCRELEGEVRLEYETAGTVHELSARSLIVATPATIARELASPLDSACAEFLHGVRCGRYAVVAFALAMTPGWGYGMDDAVVSGRTTGALVKAMLEHDTGGAAA